MSSKQYGPSVPMFRLYERESKNGVTYLVGPCGIAQIVGFRSREPNERGQYVWTFSVQERPERRDHQAPSGHVAEPTPDTSEAPRSYDRGMNDAIPF